jgi:Putative glutamine amidotransferase
MTMPSLIWGSPHWMTGALVLLGVAGAAVLWSYARAKTSRSVKMAAAALKAVGFSALAISLLDPLLSGTRPLRGANAFVILADNSQSLGIHNDHAKGTRGEWLRGLLRQEEPWRTRLGQDFDVRGYIFDTHLRGVDGFDAMTFDGSGTALGTSLAALSRRFRGLPLAGVLLLTDGNRTDVGDVDLIGLPPIYPVAPPAGGVAKDVGISQVSVSQTNFESAPAVIRADVGAVGLSGKPIVAVVCDEQGKELQRQQMLAAGNDKRLSFRFQFRPERKGENFYRVRAFAASDEKQAEEVAGHDQATGEQTLANNSRLVVIDQGGGPYRVLYVSGRPDWEFKFLRRALEEDDQIELAGLVRIARRQAKFNFRDSRTRSTSPLFDGFDHPDADTAERSDQAVFIRVGDKLDGVELRDGFPKTADELYRYHAIVLDDLEAGFFNPDQLGLIRNFVSQRGGGLLMLGGPDSFASGKYDRTPVGELLPVYLNRSDPGGNDEQEYRLALTSEGWLQPWVRLRKTEEEDRLRLTEMTSFDTLNPAAGIKPGAVVLAEVTDNSGAKLPALVAHQFGKGHVGALLIGRLWRWGLRRDNSTESDLERSWRQTVRWLVGDVPARVNLSVQAKADSSAPAIELAVRVRDAQYRPLDNAKVALKITLPGGDSLTIDAEPDAREAGMYSATYFPKQQGAYRMLATASAPDGSAIGTREAGWAAQPAADEFARLEPDREFLKTIASKTGGQVVDGDRLASFVASLSSKSAPITEPWTSPLWHQPLYFLIAITCLAGEWGLRRVNGLA